jgi:hypothetical protein
VFPPPVRRLALLACATLGCTADNPAYEAGGFEGDGSADGGTSAATAASTSASTSVLPGTGEGSLGDTTTPADTTADGSTTETSADDSAPASSSGDEPRRVLLVTQLGDLSLPLDITLAGVLASLELEVLTIEDEVLTAADADDVDLVVVSETATAAVVGATLRDVARPVVALEGGIWFPMGMAPFANMFPGNHVFIAAPEHPIAGGLVGVVPVLVEDPGSGIFATAPAPTAQVVARAFHSTGPIAVFAFEAGVPMEGGFPAPAARVALGFNVDSAGLSTADLTADGATMFAAAVVWALP